ncbi:MAG: GNAT family N-acetyltransferase, partial [Pseudomonadota bacterium]|nr:GNAT family N-acetyltransferase [Pseudomonadota bacterium]
FATEAARPVLEHALATLELTEVVADINVANAASLAVARKLGMRRIGPAPYGGGSLERYVLIEAFRFSEALPTTD